MRNDGKWDFSGSAVVVEEYGNKLSRNMIDSKAEVWYHGKAVQLIDEVDLTGVKYMEMSREGKVELSCGRRIYVSKLACVCQVLYVQVCAIITRYF